MPKQVWKIDQFHGGLSSNSDPRDIVDNELSDATDIMVDELGKIRTMGTATAHDAGKPDDDIVSGWDGTLVPGYGLFHFSHDRLGAEDMGSDELQTGDRYLALYDGNDGQVWIYSKERNIWDDVDDGSDTYYGPIDIGDTDTATAQVSYYAVDGALRVCDGNFTSQNTSKWYGYVSGKFFGGSSNHGHEITTWTATDMSLNPLTIGDVCLGKDDHIETDPVLTLEKPIGIKLQAAYSGDNDSFEAISQDGITTASPKVITGRVHYQPGANGIITHNSLGGQDKWNISKFCSAGDTIFIHLGEAGGNRGLKHVDSIDESSASYDVLYTDSGELSGEDTPDGESEFVMITNLSKMEWFDDEDQQFNLGVSTLYDEDEQESDIDIWGETLDYTSIVGGMPDIDPYYFGNADLDNLTVDFYVYTSTATGTDFSAEYPRVTGFKVYFKKSNDTVWYLLTKISMENGIQITEEGESYIQWSDIDTTYNIAHFSDNPGIPSISLGNKPSLISYEVETGSEVGSTRITKFKTAVVANRMTYIGNVNYDDVSYGDKMIKSGVNQFDFFIPEREIEASIKDGDNIVKLEEYADRILQFKNNKMHLINISQEIEFLEDTFMHKGINHHAATCKTDFGIAWINRLGCYLYDGQKVSNLLEKAGRQIIKESDWNSFTTDNSIIGYFPKKRQLIVLKDCTATSEGDIYLFDMVTQSWVKGDSKFLDEKIRTNFVTDWNADLVCAHSEGDTAIWNDASVSTSTIGFLTKDIDFGQPAQRKKVHKVIITYKSDGDSNVSVNYYANGISTSAGLGSSFSDTTSTKYVGTTLDDTSNLWATAELKPSVSINNIYSLRLRFLRLSGDVPDSFEINDISIVYKLKSVR